MNTPLPDETARLVRALSAAREAGDYLQFHRPNDAYQQIREVTKELFMVLDARGITPEKIAQAAQEGR